MSALTQIKILPRDIVARTILKTGNIAIPILIENLY